MAAKKTVMRLRILHDPPRGLDKLKNGAQNGHSTVAKGQQNSKKDACALTKRKSKKNMETKAKTKTPKQKPINRATDIIRAINQERAEPD